MPDIAIFHPQLVHFAVVLGMVGSATSKNKADRETTGFAATSTATPTSAAREVKPTKREEPSVEVSATALFNAYEANEVAADDRYKGKKLLVTGTLASVDKDFTDSVVLHLAGPNPFMHISATLDDDEKSKAARLSKGDKVTVLCEGRGRIVGSPVLGDCVVK